MLDITFKSRSELDKFLKANCYEETKYCTNPFYLDAIIGISDTAQVVYNYEKMIESLAKDYEGQEGIEDPYEDAMEWINYNMVQGYSTYPIVVMENPAADSEYYDLFKNISEKSYMGNDMNGVHIFDSKLLTYKEYQDIEQYAKNNEEFEYKIV